MKRMMFTAAALLAAGCVGDTSSRQAFTFDFSVVREGWVFGAADYPEAQAAAVDAFGTVQLLPAPLPTTQNALYLRGTNVSGDLFLFQKRYFSGLVPSTPYTISLQVDIVTNYQAGCTTGPGPVTYLKAGLSSVEPLTFSDQGIVRMTIDKGTGAAAGDFTQLGDIRNGLTGCPATGTFAERTTTLGSQTSTLITDSEGGFWVFIGTQSALAGQHEIYITGMKIVVQ
ncbi:MAG TPA: hypothetical protein VFU23_07530 [Gemmatimonadales bacterium]|nr:hypothetical protein [Gemmatimonadales bacterium]